LYAVIKAAVCAVEVGAANWGDGVLEESSSGDEGILMMGVALLAVMESDDAWCRASPYGSPAGVCGALVVWDSFRGMEKLFLEGLNSSRRNDLDHLREEYLDNLGPKCGVGALSSVSA